MGLTTVNAVGKMERILRSLSETESAQAEDRLSRLTRRELEVLRILATGVTSKQVAQQFGVSRRTVELHRSSLLAKLGARNLVQAIGEIAMIG